MGHKYYPIKGIPIQGAEEGIRTDTPVPVRREVNDFFGSNDREDKIRAVLFVLALQRFQQMSPKSRDSYFQIAGETLPSIIIIEILQQDLIEL